MRKKILLLIALFVSSATFAQSTQKFHFGLKAAPSLAWLKTDSKELKSNGSKLGFSYGLITEFNFADHYAFATGIDIVYRGGKFKYSLSDSVSTINTSSEFTLQYVEIPLTLKLKTKEIGFLTYFLQFGVAPGYNIRARSDYSTTVQVKSTGTSVSAEETDVDIQKDIVDVNVSMIIMGGAEYTISGSTVLSTAITFNNGFLDVLDNKDIKANSNYLALTIAILF
jgi:hypothetical protein